MIGVIAGDIAGSRFERINYKSKDLAHKSKDFELFVPEECSFTDDTVLSMAVAEALMQAEDKDLSTRAVESMQTFGRQYPNCGFGGTFCIWVQEDDPRPYGSYGNGAPMRVSACAWKADSLEEAQSLAEQVSAVSHNHPEAMKGAQAVASAIYLARTGKSKDEIREYIVQNYYPLDFTIDEIRPTYEFDVSAQGSVPQALQAFFESTDFEDAIRTAVSVGGDSDTIAAMAGSIAEAYYGVPDDIREQTESFLDDRLLGVLHAFEDSLTQDEQD